jgi:hypothetical protein
VIAEGSSLAFGPSPRLDPAGSTWPAAARAARSQAGDRMALSTRSSPPWSNRPNHPWGTTPRAARARATCAQGNFAFRQKWPAQGKFSISPEIGTCADAADRLAVSSRKAVCQTPRARPPHCCFLVGGARQKRAGGTLRITRASGRGPVAGDRCGWRRKRLQPEFSEAPRLGRQARGKRACATIAPRHDER